MTLPLMPNPRQQFFGSDGKPLAGGKVYTYAAGTSTPKATYTDAAGTTPNANPIILNARGEATVFWNGSYKVTLTDSSGATIYTQDNIASLDAGVRADLASTDTDKGAALVGFDAGANGYVVPSTAAKFLDAASISVRALGAIGDGTLHPLSEFYGTLAAAQAVYPFATALTQSVDCCAIQLACLIAYNSAANLHPAIDLGSGAFVIDNDIQCYAYTRLIGCGAGTSNSGPPTFGWRNPPSGPQVGSGTGRGYQTTLVAKAGYNGNFIVFDSNSSPDTNTGKTVIADISIKGICFRGNWAGPDDATNTTGRAIYFNNAYLTQNSYIEECAFHNFAQDAIFMNVAPLPCRIRRLWGRYLGGSVIRINWTNDRAGHSYVFEDIQGDFIGGVSGTVDAAGNALAYQPAPIFLDASLRVAGANNNLLESIVIRDMKHEIDSWRTTTTGNPTTGTETGGSTTAFSPNTVHLHRMLGATISVQNVNTQISNPYGYSGGNPVSNAVLLVTGSLPFYRVANSRMGTPLATTDYLVDDQVRATQVPKVIRDYAFTRENRVIYANSAADTIERSGQLVESGLTRDGFDRFQRRADGLMSWGDGASALDTNLYRDAANRLRTDDLLASRKSMTFGGTTLQSSDFTLTNWGTGATIAITAGSTDARFRITITAGTTPSANPTCRLTFTENVYPQAVFLLVQMGFGGTGAYATVVPESVANGVPYVSGCSFTYIGTPVATNTYIFEGFIF
jgi:hypothetical protein